MPFLEVTSGNNSLNLIFSVMIPKQGKGRHSLCTCSLKPNLVIIGTGIERTDRQTDRHTELVKQYRPLYVPQADTR